MRTNSNYDSNLSHRITNIEVKNLYVGDPMRRNNLNQSVSEKISLFNFFKQTALFVFLFLFSFQKVSADSQTIEINELSFLCNECTNDGQGNCRIRKEDELVLTPCDKALDYLLKVRLDAELTTSEHPSPDQIQRFLLKEIQQKDQAINSLLILLQSKQGRTALLESYESILKSYLDIIAEIVVNNPEYNNTWESLWEMPNTLSPTQDAKLRASIALVHPNFGVQDLMDNLSITDYQRDSSQIATFESIFKGTEEANIIIEAKEHLEHCREIFFTNIIPPGCRNEDLSALPKSISKYLKRVQVSFLLEKIKQTKPDPFVVLNLFRKTDYDSYRTPEMHEATKSALKEILATENLITTSASDFREFSEMLLVFAKFDGEAGKLYADILVEIANNDAKRGKVNSAFDALRESFEAFSASLPTRAEVITKLKEHPAVSSSDVLKSQLDEIVSLSPLLEQEASLTTYITTFVLLIAAVLIYVKREVIFKRTLPLEIPANQLTAEERVELRNLLAFFGLPGNSSNDQLSDKFRNKAKQLHPDSGNSDEVAFSELTEKHRRAQELIRKRVS